MRREYLIAEDARARWTVEVIENGVKPGDGRPDIPALEPLDVGWPGLNVTRETIVGLQERRILLVAKLLSEAETAEHVQQSLARAQEIKLHAEALTRRATLGSFGRLDEVCDAGAQRGRGLAPSVGRQCALDKLIDEAGIPRPNTPLVDTPKFDIAQQLIVLLWGHFAGGQLARESPEMAREVRASAMRMHEMSATN
jgi:hypothetical protein